MNRMNKRRFCELVEVVCKRPAMNTPHGTLAEAISFLDAYALGKGANFAIHSPLSGFWEWVGRKIGETDRNVRGDTLLIRMFRDQDSAFEGFAELYREYVKVSYSDIKCRVRLRSSPKHVYTLLSTDQGRAKFWAESAVELDGNIFFVFPNGQTWDGRILEALPDSKYVIEYIGGTTASFELSGDLEYGTHLALCDSGVSQEDKEETYAGWVSVLMCLKAAADHGIDLRNHDPRLSWDWDFVDN